MTKKTQCPHCGEDIMVDEEGGVSAPDAESESVEEDAGELGEEEVKDGEKVSKKAGKPGKSGGKASEYLAKHFGRK